MEQEGIEPSFRVCKTRVFPFDDSPRGTLVARSRKANECSWRVLSTSKMTVETPGIEPGPPGLQQGVRTFYTWFPNRRCTQDCPCVRAANDSDEGGIRTHIMLVNSQPLSP